MPLPFFIARYYMPPLWLARGASEHAVYTQRAATAMRHERLLLRAASRCGERR